MEGMKRQIGTEFLLLLLLMMMWCGDSQQATMGNLRHTPAVY